MIDSKYKMPAPHTWDVWLHRHSQPRTVCPPWLQPQVRAGEPAGTANLLRRNFPPVLKMRFKDQRYHCTGSPTPSPEFRKTGGGGSNFKAMAPWLGPQVRERKGPRDHLIWYPSLQARKLRVPPCPRSHSSTAQGLKPLPSWVYSLFPPVLSWRLRLPLVGREGHVIK